MEEEAFAILECDCPDGDDLRSTTLMCQGA
jgi:hypothetical protein